MATIAEILHSQGVTRVGGYAVTNYVSPSQEEWRASMRERLTGTRDPQGFAQRVPLRVSKLPSTPTLRRHALEMQKQEKGHVWDHETCSTNAVMAYIRHAFTNYEEMLSFLDPGAETAYLILKDRVNKMILQKLEGRKGRHAL